MLSNFIRLSILLAAIFSALSINLSAKPQSYACLPADVKAEDIVRAVELPSRFGDVRTKKITVADALKSIKAKCSKGNLVDGKKKQIKFFRIEGCWGNPPADYLEIQARQQQELADLKREYSVIEMFCNAGGVQLIP